jgi:SAM-dependent methyltransferase
VWQRIAIDFAAGETWFSDYRHRYGPSKANFRCATAAELATEGKFDVVILSETLEHTDNPQKLLMDGVACLSANGIVIVTVPNGYGEFEIDSWIFGLLRLQKLVDAVARSPAEAVGSTDNQECGHVQFFTRGQLRKLFAACALVPFREGAASFLAGPMAGHLLARSDRLISWNARVTESLPLVMASGWYFALRRRYHDKESPSMNS